MGYGERPHGAGKSSFHLVNVRLLFEALAPLLSLTVVDLGSGRGDYTIELAKRVGRRSKVFAVDAWREALGETKNRVAASGLACVGTIEANLNELIPLPDSTADICFMASSLHDVLRGGTGRGDRA